MAIALHCSCGKRLRVKDEFAGKRVKCPACGTVLTVPARGIDDGLEQDFPPKGGESESRLGTENEGETTPPDRTKTPPIPGAASTETTPGTHDGSSPEHIRKIRYQMLGGVAGVAASVIAVTVAWLAFRHPREEAAPGPVAAPNLPRGVAPTEVARTPTIKPLHVSDLILRSVLQGHSGTIQGLDFSPDGRLLASGSDDGTVILWDASTGRELATLQAPVTLPEIEEGDDKLTEQELVEWREERKGISCVAFAPDGKALISGGYDGTVQVWNAPSWENTSILNDHEYMAIWSLSFSLDGDVLAAGVGGVNIWKSPLNGYTKTFNKSCSNALICPNGKTIALNDEGGDLIKILDMNSNKELTEFDYGTLEHSARCLSISPDGRLLASGGNDGNVILWDTSTGRARTVLRGHLLNVLCVDFSPDGRVVASGSRDFTVRIWDVATGRELTTFRDPGKEVMAVAFSPDGLTLAASWAGENDNTITLWDEAPRP
jgi:WD40 repeat protein